MLKAISGHFSDNKIKKSKTKSGSTVRAPKKPSSMPKAPSSGYMAYYSEEDCRRKVDEIMCVKYVKMRDQHPELLPTHDEVKKTAEWFKFAIDPKSKEPIMVDGKYVLFVDKNGKNKKWKRNNEMGYQWRHMKDIAKAKFVALYEKKKDELKGKIDAWKNASKENKDLYERYMKKYDEYKGNKIKGKSSSSTDDIKASALPAVPEEETKDDDTEDKDKADDIAW